MSKMAIVPVLAFLGGWWLGSSKKQSSEPAPVVVNVESAPEPTSEAALKAKMLAERDEKEIMINGQPLTTIVTPPSAVVFNAGNPPIGAPEVKPALENTAPEVKPVG